MTMYLNIVDIYNHYVFPHLAKGLMKDYKKLKKKLIIIILGKMPEYVVTKRKRQHKKK